MFKKLISVPSTGSTVLCGLNASESTEVENSTFVLRISISTKNPAHRQYAARYAALLLGSLDI